MSSPSRPAISVIIPYLNHPDALERCLTSLDLQRGGGVSFDVIVVDNGSKVLPVDICAAFPGVRLTADSNPGPGPARSHGATLAPGAILAFIDADCMAEPGWITAIAAYFAGHPEVHVVGGDVRIALVDPAHVTQVEAYESVFGYRMQLYVERDHYTATCNMAVRREVFAAVGPFGGVGIAEDVDWGRRATALGFRIAYVPQMRILTPARSSFAELARKWDRQLAHDWVLARASRAGRVKWVVKTLAVAVSPTAEVWTIAATDRLSGGGPRLRAIVGTFRIRLYRARTMLSLIVGDDPARFRGSWNRPT
jgi:GT2 family glycosyltransferase